MYEWYEILIIVAGAIIVLMVLFFFSFMVFVGLFYNSISETDQKKPRERKWIRKFEL